MWKRKKKTENKKMIKVKLGETFSLGPGDSASFEIPPEVTLNRPGKIVARYEDKYGNIYETSADVDIENNTIVGKKLKTKTRTIYYAPFRKRVLLVIIPIFAVIFVGIISYFLTGSYFPILFGLGIILALQIMLEIIYMRVNKKYNETKISLVKEE